MVCRERRLVWRSFSEAGRLGKWRAGNRAESYDPNLLASRQEMRSLLCAQCHVDFVSSENSMGFHAPREAARILGEAIDLARKGQIDLLAKTMKPASGSPKP
jgi:nitrite reductase (cytochrome c-552)